MRGRPRRLGENLEMKFECRVAARPRPTRRLTEARAGAMEFYRQDCAVDFEVGVEREDFHFVPDCDGADEQIGAGALDSFVAALVVEVGGEFIILFVGCEVREEAQVVAKLHEAGIGTSAGKQFLPDRAEHLDGIGPNEAAEFRRDGSLLGGLLRAGTPEEFRPGAGIDDHFHPRPRRIFL